MPRPTTRFYALQLTSFVLLALMLAGAQANLYGPYNRDMRNKDVQNDAQNSNKDRQNPAPSPATPGADYSGMYSFLREGEFVQVTVEDEGRVIGLVSRYDDSEGDRGVFLDHFFKSGKLDGNQLAFTTETVHGVSFEFRGTVERGEGKSRGDEAYYVLKGTLVENTIDEAKKNSSRLLDVVLRSFPQNASPAQAEKK
jgi:hypothetical protein